MGPASARWRSSRLVALVGIGIALVGTLAVALPPVRQALRDRVSVRGVLAAIGLRAETSGSGRPRSLGLDRLDEHYRELEERRAADRAALAQAPVAAASVPAPPTSTPSAPVAVAPSSASPATTASAASRAPREPTVQPAAQAVAPAASAHVQPTADEWPSFRGARRDGRYAGPPVLTAWPTAGPRELWRTPVGGGYASMTTVGGRLFTIEQRRHQEVAAAYDLETGRELWSSAWDAAFTESMGGDGPRATPTVAHGMVYALGAQGELRALDAASGRTVWRTNILAENDAENLQWGMAASPLVLDDLVVVIPGGGRGQSVVAYDRLTGARRWTALDDQAAYTAPMDVTIDGVRQLLLVTGTRALGLTLDGRNVLWSFPWTTEFGVNTAQPVVFDDRRVFLSAGYGHGAAVLDVRRQGETFRVDPVWQNTRMKNKFTSSVLHDGHFYGLDEAILACIDASTGALKWKGGRYGYGQVILVGDQVWVTTEDGDVVQVAASPDGHKELGRFKALEGKTWNHPILSGGRLVVRNQTEMAAYDVRLPATAPSQP